MKVRRAEGHRRLRFLLGAVGLVALAVGAWGLTRTPLLDLDHVRFEGVAGADARTVEQITALESGTPMFDLDLGEVERSLTALPWVEDASATRDWPGTVVVSVEVRTAVASVGPLGEPTVLADRNGVLVRNGDDGSLPRVAVTPTVELGEVDERALTGIDVALALPEDLRVWVDAVTIADEAGSDGRPGLGLDLVGSAVVELGSADFISDKLAAVRAVLEGTDLTCVGVIDVAVADRPVIRSRAGCDTAAPTTDGGDA